MLQSLLRFVLFARIDAIWTAVSRLALAALWLLPAICWTPGPANALPVFARQYHVSCAQCHSVPPRLNTFGYAFQANHFNWPGPDAPARAKFGKYLPITAIGTASYSNDVTGRQETLNFRTFELFFAGGLGFGPARQGGFFINLIAADTGDTTNGDLENAYVSLPLLGRRGQLAVTAGQVTPLLYQYDSVNSLADTIPYAFSEGVDEFAFGSPMPMVRLDYFDNRGKASPDGNYLSVAVPFRGHLELTRHATVGPEIGIFAHGFRRWGNTTIGALGFFHENNHLVGLVSTYAPSERIYLTGVATLGRQPARGDTRGRASYGGGPGPVEAGSSLNTSHLALEAEYLPTKALALTGRVELIGGDLSDLATVAAINYYPLKLRFLRLSAESHQRRGDRGFDVTLRLQY